MACAYGSRVSETRSRPRWISEGTDIPHFVIECETKRIVYSNHKSCPISGRSRLREGGTLEDPSPPGRGDKTDAGAVDFPPPVGEAGVGSSRKHPFYSAPGILATY